jgi:tetraacyldisaccharide 4'-kinase
VRKLLFPLSLIYGFIIWFRNFLFNRKFLKVTRFNIPVILAGNLSAGGTGKTPCVEYLIRFLKEQHRIAVLSRGYLRKTKGFQIATPASTAREVGDEPLQIALKFPEVTVAVDRNRRNGIRTLMGYQPPPDCIIMDDGFQHRSVEPGLSILLTEYNNLYMDDLLLPAGTLREHQSNAARADIIVITKSPRVHSPITEKILIKRLKPRKNQLLFFSYIRFSPLQPLFPGQNSTNQPVPNTIVLFTGIANPAPLQQHLQDLCSNLISVTFPDHHHYGLKDIAKITKVFNDQFTKNKILVTTEKDLSRLKHEETFDILRNFPVFCVPIAMAFHPHIRGYNFDQAILDYVRKHQNNHCLDSSAPNPKA